ncbi:MAG: TraA family conjugative transfer protein [Rhodanobacter sp.]
MTQTIAMTNHRYARQRATFAIFTLLLAAPAFAGTGNSASNPFSGLVTMITGWLKGGLGLMLALLSLAVGIIAGLVRGSIGGALTAVGVAIACYWGPDILTSMFGATLLG